MTNFEDLPVGTICGPGREFGPFIGRPDQIPRGWVICAGQVLTKDKHNHPTKDEWKLLDLSREFITGGSTHLTSQMDDDGTVMGLQADNQNPPGQYTIIKVRHD